VNLTSKSITQGLCPSGQRAAGRSLDMVFLSRTPRAALPSPAVRALQSASLRCTAIRPGEVDRYLTFLPGGAMKE
jgi:hypothetical protein